MRRIISHCYPHFFYTVRQTSRSQLTKGTLQYLPPKITFLNNSVIYESIELKGGLEIKFELLSSESSNKLQNEVIMTL